MAATYELVDEELATARLALAAWSDDLLDDLRNVENPTIEYVRELVADHDAAQALLAKLDAIEPIP